MNVDDLIENYVADVARLLPRKQRNDVAFELRSLLNDELQAKAEAAQCAVNADMATELLRKFGRPEEVAARYRSPGFTIIEAVDAPNFVMVATVGVLLQWAVSLYHAFSTPSVKLAAWWGSSGLPALWWPGFLVICYGFAGAIRRHALLKSGSEWQPIIPDLDRINRAALTLGLVAWICGAAILISLPWALPWIEQLIGGPVGQNVHRVLAYHEDFLQRGPWLLPFWAGHFILYWVVIIEGRWRELTRRIDITFGVITCGLLVWFIADGPVFQAAPTDKFAKVCVALIYLVVLTHTGIKRYRERARRIQPPVIPGGKSSI